MAHGGNNSGKVVLSSPAVMEDMTSPYFLHNSDHPGLILVTHSLTGSNYNTWKRSMLMALATKNKACFVDGSLSEPNSNDLLYQTWSRCNNMVSSWIVNSVSKDIADSILYISSATGIWQDLKDHFLQSNRPRAFQIKNMLIVSRQGSMDVSIYYTKLKILWDELKEFQLAPNCRCGETKQWLDYQDQECVMQFLMGLNDSFAQVRAQILMLELAHTITKAFSLIVQKEHQRTINPIFVPAALDQIMSMDSNSPSVNASVVSSGPGFFTVKQHRDHYYCTHCNMKGHTKELCFKLNGYPQNFKFKNRAGDSNTWHINQLAAPSSRDVSNSNAKVSLNTLTTSQYNKLLALLNCSTSVQSSPDTQSHHLLL